MPFGGSGIGSAVPELVSLEVKGDAEFPLPNFVISPEYGLLAKLPSLLAWAVEAAREILL